MLTKKQRLVEVLEAKLQASLEGAISCAGSPKVALRRVLKSIQQGWSPDCETRSKENGEWGVLKVGCVNGWRFNPKEHKTLPAMLNPRPLLETKNGDVLMSRANTPDLVGSVAVVQGGVEKLMLCDKLYRLSFDETLVLPEFALLALRSKQARYHYSSRANGASSSMQNISQETVRTFMISLPSIEQQGQEVTRFEKTKQVTNKVSDLVLTSITRLNEYRSALITAAVTGQIDVDAYARTGSTDRRIDTLEQEANA